MVVNYCSIFGTYLVKFGNTDYRGHKLSSLEGGEADGKEVHPSVMPHWQGEGEAITQIHSALPNTAARPPVPTRLPSLHMCSSYPPASHRPLRAKSQNTCWWAQTTASPLHHYRNNKGRLIKSSRMSMSHGMQWHGGWSQQRHSRALSPSLRTVPRNFGCVSKCDKGDSTGREETAHSNQTQGRRTPEGKAL